MKIKRRVPNFVDYTKKGDPTTFEVQSQEELLALPWIAARKEAKGFVKFSVNRTAKYLMAEYNDGYVWYVVGRLDTVEGLDLPDFEPKHKPDSKHATGTPSPVRQISVEQYLREKRERGEQ